MIPDKSNKIIEIKSLEKTRNNIRVLQGINLEINKGMTVSIIGRSGCGKTSLLRCINCLDDFDEGYLRVSNIEIVRKKKEIYEKASNLKYLHDRTYRQSAFDVRSKIGLLLPVLKLGLLGSFFLKR